jgi:hypothetical protein
MGNINIKEQIISKDTKGIFNKISICYKVDKLNEETIINIPETTSFKVVGFNLITKRIRVFLHIKGMNTEIVELDYETILNNTILENSNIFSTIDAILIRREEKNIIRKENIDRVVFYVIMCLVMFLLGRVI